MLYFGLGNTKLKDGQAIFDLPAGHSCPFAFRCKSCVNRVTGKITDGPNTHFRCYAATLEMVRPIVRERRWHNFETIRKFKTSAARANAILANLPSNMLVRIHSSGDFFSQTYFDAWVKVAQSKPDTIFYAYTKALPYWVKRIESIPSNLCLNASYGGTHDHLIGEYGFKSVQVVYSEEEATRLGLECDKDDRHAWKQNKNFAILIHGMGPKGSVQAKLHIAKMHAMKG